MAPTGGLLFDLSPEFRIQDIRPVPRFEGWRNWFSNGLAAGGRSNMKPSAVTEGLELEDDC
jgi:hypothetical protein